MELSFDTRGHLKPYEKLELNYDAFKTYFVEAFETGSTRHKLFKHYEKLTNDFREKITGNFTQWINGSFVSNKTNPHDIDLVTLLEYEIAEKYDDLIKSSFIGSNLYKQYRIDAYLVVMYPENHRKHKWTKSDLFYWYEWFTKSKMNRQRKRFPKRFIEIKFEAKITKNE